MTASLVQSMCMEKRVFYRVISGLHSCINLHVAAAYPQPQSMVTFPPQPTIWGPNMTMFEMFFDPKRTWGEGPARLRNMYFTYLLLLRAVVKGEHLWKSKNFHSGNLQQDVLAEHLVARIVTESRSTCGAVFFDETSMFHGDLLSLKAEFSLRFRNVSVNSFYWIFFFWTIEI